MIGRDRRRPRRGVREERARRRRAHERLLDVDRREAEERHVLLVAPAGAELLNGLLLADVLGLDGASREERRDRDVSHRRDAVQPPRRTCDMRFRALGVSRFPASRITAEATSRSRTSRSSRR